MPALVTNSLDLAQIAPSFKLHRLNLHNIYWRKSPESKSAI
jgi:hypothetical protein